METGKRRPGNEARAGEQPGAYRPTWIDRHGGQGVFDLTIFAYCGVVFVCLVGALGALARYGLISGWVVLPAALVLGGGGMAVMLRATHGVARGFGALTLPSGDSTPYEHQFSLEDAMAARGDLAAALESLEALIAATPITGRSGVEVRVKAAEMYARPKGDPRRGAELFRTVQRIPELPVARDVYVSNRLIDLYLGPLRDEGRALVELRRLAEKYPGTDTAAGALAAIARIKAADGGRGQS
jgi:hypothetical protein